MYLGSWKRFQKSERGGVAAETVIWIPFVFLLTLAMADTFFVYTRHAMATVALEDATRLLITGALADCSAFLQQVDAMVQPFIPSAAAHCSMSGAQANVALVLPASEMGIGALPGFIDNFNLSTVNVKTLEYFEGT